MAVRRSGFLNQHGTIAADATQKGIIVFARLAIGALQILCVVLALVLVAEAKWLDRGTSPPRTAAERCAELGAADLRPQVGPERGEP
jgi:hypothetical protein